MPNMIKDGFFINGEKFYLKNSDKTANLMEDGKLFFDDKIYDMHTLAAKIKNVKASRLNGFNYWQVIRNEKRISIDEVRNLYRSSLDV